MSAPTGEVLKPILLRSITPGSNEKVLQYLEGMNKHSAGNTPPLSVIDEGISHPKSPNSDRNLEHGSVGAMGSPKPKLYAPSPKPSKVADPSKLESRSAREYENADDDGDDVGSNVQEGQRSELGELVLPVREPGPEDPPGPRYESFDSGPSFGNFGPLPTDQYAMLQSQPRHPDQQAAWATTQPLNMNGSAFGNHVKTPLQESVVSPKANSIHINGDSPSSLLKGKSRGSHHPSESEARSPKAPSKIALSRSGDADRPLSPQSVKSRVTSKTHGTGYQPVQANVTGGVDLESPPSPTRSQVPRSFRALSKVPSISPSDSPSQMKPRGTVARSPPLSPVKSVHTSSEAGGPASPVDVSRNGSRHVPPSPAARSQTFGSAMAGPSSHQIRPFSPYRHAATDEDLLHAAIRGRAMVLPDSEVASKQPSVHANGKRTSTISQANNNNNNNNHVSRSSSAKPPTVHSQVQTRAHSHGNPDGDADVTPTPSRPHSPGELNGEEEKMVQDTLTARTPRTSYYAMSSLEPDVANSHFHDMDLCVLLHQENDPSVHEVVRKALRKAVRQRIKKLGMLYDHESIKQYKKSYHDHDPSVHLQDSYRPPGSEDPPGWARQIIDGMARMQEHIDGLGPKIEGLRESRSYGGDGSRYKNGQTFHSSEIDEYGRSPMTQTVNIHTQPTGTMADSMFQPAETVHVDSNEDGLHRDGDSDEEGTHGGGNRRLATDGDTRTRGPMSEFTEDGRDDSPGQQFLEEELYKLRQKPHGSQSALSHRTWEVAKDDDDMDEGEEDEDGHPHHAPASGLPTIPDSNGGGYPDHRGSSPPLPPIPQEDGRDVVPSAQQQMWHHNHEFGGDSQPSLPPWQRIHQRLLSWAIIWPMSELDTALNSTTRGHQVDEVALSIWSTQTYKRYVRARMTDSPQGVVDRLFVPPNMADAISNAVFNGRHGDACGMLRDLWSPFGLEGMPRLLVVLAKHRSDENHWVVHRFSLPEGGLTTYDSYPERTLPDGRPLGWWFAIRVAWPNVLYPSPDNLMQKMVRLHRPMQLAIDNSVAAAGIWRNILMGSRAERSLDLERLRDLINTEVRNLRQRKQMGKLSIGSPRPTWEDMN